ncbi:hypothetical protein TNCV_3465991 [Trichonephila clavipes]|nr:hypothetical protein TNCV_3465991 [Trichonephila clavipes]
MEFWRYSNITCSGYPLNALDSLQPNGRASRPRVVTPDNRFLDLSSLLTSRYKALMTDLVTLNYSQVTRLPPELEPSPNCHATPMGGL